MTREQENQAMAEIMESQPHIQTTDAELLDMFENFIKHTEEEEEEIPTLPRGFGQ